MAGLGTPIRLAIVDGDSAFLHVLEKRAQAHGWQQHAMTRPATAEELAALRVGALVVDLALVRDDPWEYLRSVHEALPSLPLVVCTAGASVAQRIRGLRLGADDWLAKPCHPEELIARVEASVRRGRLAGAAAEPGSAIDAGELQIRPDRYQAFVGAHSLNLTRREFQMLRLLAGNGGQVLEREAIYLQVWGYAMAHGDRSVDVFVRKLRAKLERGSPRWRYIHTHFGVGYRFEARPVDEEDRFVASEPATPARASRATPHLAH